AILIQLSAPAAKIRGTGSVQVSERSIEPMTRRTVVRFAAADNRPSCWSRLCCTVLPVRSTSEAGVCFPLGRPTWGAWSVGLGGARLLPPLCDEARGNVVQSRRPVGSDDVRGGGLRP